VISDLWFVDVTFPFKNENICELIRGVFLGLSERNEIELFLREIIVNL
jgi:hypothetical protein